MDTQRTRHRREWLIAAGLIVLALIPSLAGAMRIGEIAASAPETAENMRFLRMPLPVALHIIAAVVYTMVGAFQFLPGFRRRHLGWHRFSGRYLLVPTGLIVGATGLWMTAFYDTPPVDGTMLQYSRYLVGALMILFIVLALIAIARKDVPTHGAWMIRAYALAMGAGTQVLTSAPFLVMFGTPSEFWRLVQMDAGWLINIVVAEIVIRRTLLRPSTRTPRSATRESLVG